MESIQFKILFYTLQQIVKMEVTKLHARSLHVNRKNLNVIMAVASTAFGIVVRKKLIIFIGFILNEIIHSVFSIPCRLKVQHEISSVFIKQTFFYSLLFSNFINLI